MENTTPLHTFRRLFSKKQYELIVQNWKKLQPGEQHSRIMLDLTANSYANLGYYKLASSLFKMALEEDASCPITNNNYLSCLYKINEFHTGLKHFEKLEKKRELSADERLLRTSFFRSVGQIEEAGSELLDLIYENPMDVRFIYNFLTISNDPEALKQIYHLLMNRPANEEPNAILKYCLYIIDAERKSYNSAFNHLEMSKEILKTTSDTLQNDNTLFVTLSDVFKRLDVSPEPKSELEDISQISKPIFIVGMPRTGSTLIASILSAHPSVEDFGEIDALSKALNYSNLFGELKIVDVVRNTRLRYLSLSSQYSQNAPIYFIDKSPLNFRFIPILRSTFPNCKIIWTLREQTRNKYSIYTKFFTSGSHSYAHDINRLHNYFKLHDKALEECKRKYEDSIFCLQYDDLVQSPNQVMKSVFAYCDLHWKEDYLNHNTWSRLGKTASAMQVLEPINNKGRELNPQFQYFLKTYLLNL